MGRGLGVRGGDRALNGVLVGEASADSVCLIGNGASTRSLNVLSGDGGIRIAMPSLGNTRKSNSCLIASRCSPASSKTLPSAGELP